MTDPMRATPGWVDEALDRLFEGLGAELGTARDAFSACLAGKKEPAAPSDLLGAEFETCHSALRNALFAAGLERDRVADVLRKAEALEAGLAADS